MLQYNLILPADNALPVVSGIVLKQGDSGIILNLSIDNMDLSQAAKAKVVFYRANGTSVEYDSTEVSNPMSYTLKGNELAVPGKTVMDVKFYDAQENRISTASVLFDVEPDTLDGIGAGAGGYSDQLEQLTKRADDLIEEISPIATELPEWEQAETARASAETAREEAEAARVQAEAGREGEINRLSESITDILKDVTNTEQHLSGRNLFDKSKVIVDKTYNINWDIIDSVGNDLTDFIPVQSGKTLYVSNTGVPITTDYQVLYMYTFDAYKKPILRTAIATTKNPTYSVEDGVCFVRYCFKHGIINGLQIEYDGITHYSAYNPNVADTLLSDVPINLFVCDKATSTISGITFTNYGDGRIQLGGTATNELWADYYVADISAIGNNTVMTFGCDVLAGSADGIILNGYMRANRTANALKSVTSVNGVAVQFTKSAYASPNDVKVLTVSIHLKVGAKPNCVIAPTLVVGDRMINGLLNGKTMSPKAYTDSKLNNDNSWKINLYRNAIFCGDSVTEGYVVDGSIYEVESEYAYPTQFGKIYPKLNITNAGQTGISPKQFLDNKYQNYNFADYDLIVVELGYNGTDAGYLNINDYETDGKNTFAYRILIKRIRQQNATADIVLVCSSHAPNLGNDGDWLPILNKMANEYNCKVINLLDHKYLNLDADEYHGTHEGVMDYIHFNRKGYNAKAYVVSRMLADIL